MMSYVIHLLVVIHQEFGNLGIQNRKGLSLVSFNGKLVVDISEVLEKPLCFNGYCKAINIAATQSSSNEMDFLTNGFLDRRVRFRRD